MDQKDSYIGIDFGTNTIYVSICYGSNPQLALSSLKTINNSTGRGRGIKSLMGYNKEQTLCCESGLYGYRQKPENFVTNIKQYIGKRVSSYTPKGMYEQLMEIREDKDGNPLFVISPDGIRNELVSVELVCSLILKEIYGLIKQDLSSFKGENVTVTIPVYWHKDQIMSLQRALSCAGFSNCEFIYEIEALSLQYGFYRNTQNDFVMKTRRVLFIDVGYSHTCVFCTDFADNRFDIIYCESTETCGGQLFDNVMIGFVEDCLNDKYHIPRDHIHADKRQMVLILQACEKAKQDFSLDGVDEVVFTVFIREKGDDVEFLLTTAEFLKRCSSHHIFETLTAMCSKCLNEVENIDFVEFVGSSARFLKMRQIIGDMLLNYGNKNTAISYTMNMEEDACHGCCIHSLVRNNADVYNVQVNLPSSLSSYSTSSLSSLDMQPLKDDDMIYRQLQEKQKEVEKRELKAKELLITKREIETRVQECQSLVQENNSILSHWFSADLKDYLRVIQNELVFTKGQNEPSKYNDLLNDIEGFHQFIQNMVMNSKDGYCSQPVMCIDPYSRE